MVDAVLSLLLYIAVPSERFLQAGVIFFYKQAGHNKIILQFQSFSKRQEACDKKYSSYPALFSGKNFSDEKKRHEV